MTRLSHEGHLRAVRKHGTILLNLPGSLVGEWSLSRPGRVTDDQIKEWGEVQAKQYGKSSHGSFFWNWKDFPSNPDWDIRIAIDKGWIEVSQKNISLTLTLTRSVFILKFET